MKTIYISGATDSWYQSTRLSETASAIRMACRRARVVPVGYGNADNTRRAVFPDFEYKGDWRGISRSDELAATARSLQSDGWWFAAFAPQIKLMKDHCHPRFCAPPAELVAKPDHSAAMIGQSIGFSTVPFTSLAASAREVHEFGREWGWHLTITASGETVTEVSDRRSAESTIAELSRVWPVGDISIRPSPVSWTGGKVLKSRRRIGLATWNGQLIHAVALAEGGAFEPLPTSLWECLSEAVQHARWTGGVDLEIGELDGDPVLVRWMHGFPVWVSKAADAGHNGPGALMDALSEKPAAAASPFVQTWSSSDFRQNGSHPEVPELSADAFVRALASAEPVRVTPSYLFLPTITAGLWNRAADAIGKSKRSPGPVTKIAVSLKTNPSAELLRSAKERGFLAEAISGAEAEWAVKSGFRSSEIILNGPGKLWPHGLNENDPPAVIFADSISELAKLVHRRNLGTVGVRLRPPGVPTRFGVPITSEKNLEEIARLLRTSQSTEIGISFHYNSHWLGWRRWHRAVHDVIVAADRIQLLARRPITVLDIGGGWFPDDWYSRFLPALAGLEEQIAARLPAVRMILIEPGKALAQPTHAFVSRILDVRRSVSGEGEIIVDGSIAELQAALAYPRHVAWKPSTSDHWLPLGIGASRVLGRLCMENDILANRLDIPERMGPDDFVAFSDAGAYDMSMSYSFARGGSAESASLSPSITTIPAGVDVDVR